MYCTVSLVETESPCLGRICGSDFLQMMVTRTTTTLMTMAMMMMMMMAMTSPLYLLVHIYISMERVPVRRHMAPCVRCTPNWASNGHGLIIQWKTILTLYGGYYSICVSYVVTASVPVALLTKWVLRTVVKMWALLVHFIYIDPRVCALDWI